MVFTRKAVTLNRDKLSHLAPSSADGSRITIPRDHDTRSVWRFSHVCYFPDVEKFRMELLGRMELKGTFGALERHDGIAFLQCGQFLFCQRRPNHVHYFIPL